MTLLQACLVALAGVGIGLAENPRPEVLAVGGLAAFLGAVVSWRAGRLRTSRWLLLAAVAALGAGRGAATVAALPLSNPYADSGTREMLCRVISDPGLDGLWQRYTCSVLQVDDSPVAPWSAAVTGRPLIGLQYGDIVRLTGKPRTPTLGVGSGYRDYLARRGVSAVIRADAVEFVGPGSVSLRRVLFGLRRRALDGLLEAVPEPEASFLSGIVLGTAEGLPQGAEEDLRRSGLLHILVVSGFNVSIMAAAVVGLLRRPLGWGVAFGAAAALCLGYSVLTGGDPPVVRGSVMVLLAVGAQVVGRPGHGWTALALAVGAMALASPLLLLEPSYQLSVATSAGMLWAQGRNWRLWAGLRPLGPMASAMVTTLAAQVASLPISAAHFGRLPGLGLLSNALVLPLQPAQMMAALAGAGSALVGPALAQLVALPGWALARLTLGVAHLAARVPLASLECPPWSPAAVTVYYGVLLLLVSGPRRTLGRWLSALKAWRPPRRLPLWVVGTILTVAVWAVALQLPDGRLHLAFLDVGQGDSILITTPSGRRVVVDGGADPDALRGYLGRALPVWQRHLDVVLLTHPDLDHMGGLLGLVPRYSVGLLLSPAAPVPTAWARQWESVADRSVNVTVVAAGQIVDLGDGVELQVLYPPATGCPGWIISDNDCSAVVQVSYGEATVLLTGDAEWLVEQRLIAEGAAKPSWLLKVSHHGSARATSDGLLEALGPGLAVISVGENRYGHPAAEVLERLRLRGIQCLRTDQLGTIEIVTDGVRYSVRAHR
ncbi:MAG: DUF4131 domain-containing protein [Anaerolineae bacterium]|nr:DUF4131 domain-containing protein [Anaerolineae bacterium]